MELENSHWDAVIIGGGQAGLSTGYFLKKINKRFIILDENGRIVKVRSVIWATGYKPDFSWIGLDVTDETGWPVTRRGISTVQKGLYFVGMPFQYGLTSGLVGGVGRDARFISRHLHNARE